jgi:hypothetical protein
MFLKFEDIKFYTPSIYHYNLPDKRELYNGILTGYKIA